MRFIVPSVAEVRLTIMRGAAYWRAPDRACDDDAFPPEKVLRRWVDFVAASPTAASWFAPRLFWVEAVGAIVGTGSFKTAPDDPLGVEIGYGIAARHRGQGYATEAVRLLVTEAFACSDTPHVFATVNPTNLASQRVLAKCGFVREGEALDPDDGLVWRFVLPRTGTKH
jgi:ribosomal-protein-alanine N-acetyltransferase